MQVYVYICVCVHSATISIQQKDLCAHPNCSCIHPPYLFNICMFASVCICIIKLIIDNSYKVVPPQLFLLVDEPHDTQKTGI